MPADIDSQTKKCKVERGKTWHFYCHGGAGLLYCLQCFSILEGGEGLSWKVAWAVVSKEKSPTHMVASAYDPSIGVWGGRIAMSLGQPGLCRVRLHLKTPKTKQTHQATTEIPVKTKRPKSDNRVQTQLPLHVTENDLKFLKFFLIDWWIDWFNVSTL